MEHLLNNCIFTSSLWDSFATIFQQTDRDKGSIINTLNKWRRNFSDNEVLGSAWAMIRSFIIWNVWKERNNRIFKNEKRSSQCLSKQILRQFKETISTIVQNLPKNPPSVADLRILRVFGLQGLIPQGLDRKAISLDSEQDFSHPPPKGFLKFNIDGASKGNPGTAGYGGILRMRMEMSFSSFTII